MLKRHKLFLLSVWEKMIEGLMESAIGILLYFFPGQKLHDILNYFIRYELSEDPDDWLMSHAQILFSHFSITGQNFLSFYLLSHGVVKIFLVYNLLKKRYWAYPVALLVFIAFTVYQIHLYLQAHALWMLVLIVLDVLVVISTGLEYKHILKLQKKDA